MANMSYCRFENTSSDFHDCVEAINEAVEEGKNLEQFLQGLSSDYERTAFKRMIKLAQMFQEAVEDLQGSEGVLFDNEMDA